MGLFRKRTKAEDELHVTDPMAAVPVVAENVEEGVDSHELLQLRRTFVPKDRIKRWLHDKFGWRREVQLKLDQMGTDFWRLIDGKRSVRRIAKEMRKKYDWDEKQATEAVIVYVKELMLRHMIILEVPLEATAPGPTPKRKQKRQK